MEQLLGEQKSTLWKYYNLLSLQNVRPLFKTNQIPNKILMYRICLIMLSVINGLSL